MIISVHAYKVFVLQAKSQYISIILISWIRLLHSTIDICIYVYVYIYDTLLAPRSLQPIARQQDMNFRVILNGGEHVNCDVQ